MTLEIPRLEEVLQNIEVCAISKINEMASSVVEKTENYYRSLKLLEITRAGLQIIPRGVFFGSLEYAKENFPPSYIGVYDEKNPPTHVILPDRDNYGSYLGIKNASDTKWIWKFQGQLFYVPLRYPNESDKVHLFRYATNSRDKWGGDPREIHYFGFVQCEEIKNISGLKGEDYNNFGKVMNQFTNTSPKRRLSLNRSDNSIIIGYTSWSKFKSEIKIV